MKHGQGEAARWSGASRVTKNSTARPTRLRWSGYDASEARSVHRESLWNPKRERAGLAISPRCQSPLAPSLPASCRRAMQSQAQAPGAGRTSRCPLDMPRCTNVWQSASSSRQPQWRPEVYTDDWSRVKQAPRPWPGQPGRTPMSVRHVLNHLVPGRGPERRRRRLGHGAKAHALWRR